jgi:hypothetical protein
MRWAWIEERDKPAAAGVLGWGSVARALLARARSAVEPNVKSPRWQIVAHHQLLMLTGTTECLPWVDGACYAAPRPEAPNLWLPTLERPNVALDLLAAAIGRRYPQKPILLWPDPAQLVPLNRLLPADADVFARILALWGEA